MSTIYARSIFEPMFSPVNLPHLQRDILLSLTSVQLYFYLPLSPRFNRPGQCPSPHLPFYLHQIEARLPQAGQSPPAQTIGQMVSSV